MFQALYSTCTHGGHHPLQLALEVVFPSSHLHKYCSCTSATGTGYCMWWWYVEVVAVAMWWLQLNGGSQNIGKT